jgi:hypothetical protein
MDTLVLTERTILHMMIDGTIDKETLHDYGVKKLAQLDKRNETARIRAAKKKAEPDELLDAVFNILYDQPMSREDVLEELLPEYPELTVGKVSYRLSKLVRERPNEVIKQEAFVTEDGKTKRITVYTRIG